MRNAEPCWIVFRTDADKSQTVKVVVWSESDAEDSIIRLNKLNKAKGCSYRWERSRAKIRPHQLTEAEQNIMDRAYWGN